MSEELDKNKPKNTLQKKKKIGKKILATIQIWKTKPSNQPKATRK